MTSEIKYYKDSSGNVMAIHIPDSYSAKGINFITEDSSLQQVAYMGHERGHEILPHYHNKISRNIDITSETLVMKRGIMEVTLYDNEKPIHCFNVGKGDVVTLLSGGHGFKIIEDVEMIEIKQGPFLGSRDKTRF